MDVVTIVKEQPTNHQKASLLALNAVIEALCESELGRCYEEVEGEVSMFTALTQNSTNEIQAMIEQLTEQSNNTNESMQSNLEMIERSQRLINQVNDALVSITQYLVKIRDMNIDVSAAAERKPRVKLDINRSVTNVSETESDKDTFSK